MSDVVVERYFSPPRTPLCELLCVGPAFVGATMAPFAVPAFFGMR